MRHHRGWSERILAPISERALAPAFHFSLKKFDYILCACVLMFISVSAAHAATSDAVTTSVNAYSGAYSQYYAPAITVDVPADETVFVIGKTKSGTANSDNSAPSSSVSQPQTGTQSNSAETNNNSRNHTSRSTTSIPAGERTLTLPLAKLPPDSKGATFVTGLNTAGTVRVNNLSNLEALLNVMANGSLILGLAWAGPVLMMRFWSLSSGEDQAAVGKVKMAIACVLATMATPAVINWLVASGRDAFVFIN